MPRIVRAYACAFRCGQRVTTKRADMMNHEEICIRNPQSRACPTCQHNYAERPEYSYSPKRNYECEIDELPADLTMVSGCPHWQAVIEQALDREVTV